MDIHSNLVIRTILTATHDETIVVSSGEEKTIVFVSSGLARHIHLKVRLVGKYARANVFGVVIGTNKDELQLITEQIHEAPETKSTMLVKGVFGGNARFDYQGLIDIKKDTSFADAYQKNINLLVSEFAHVKSSPILEISHNNVRCTHGATTSMIPAAPIWYMQTRGISQKRAKHVFIKGFIDDILTTIPDGHDVVDVYKRLELL